MIIKRYYRSISKMPGPSTLPVIGTLHKYLPVIGDYRFDQLHINGLKKYKLYGPIIREEIVPGTNLVWLFDPDHISKMFRSEGIYPARRSHLALQKFRLDRPDVYNTGGLLPTNGQEWCRLRKIFQTGLSSPNSVKKFLNGVNDIIEEWLDQRVESIKKQPNIDYLPELCRLFLELTGYETLDVRMNSFHGGELDPNSQSSKLIKAAFSTNSIILQLDNGFHLWKYFDTPLYKQLAESQKFMEKVALDILRVKLDKFNKNPNIDSIESTLLEKYLANPNVDLKDIVGIICDFLLAGIDTTSYTTSFLLYHLAKAPSVQMELYKEAKKLLPNINTPVDSVILSNAIYTQAVLKELLRLRPISVGIGRVLNEAVTIGDYLIPENTTVITQNQVSCRLDQYFSRAHEFKPERWLRNHPLYEKKHPFLLLPFGYGPRSCIAKHAAKQNMLVFLLKFIRRYRIEWKGATLDSKSLLINAPDNPINVELYSRN